MNINPNNQIFNVVFDICNIYKNDFTSFFNLNCGSESLFLNNKFDCNEDDNCFLFDKNSVLVGDSKNELLSKCSNIKGLYGNIIEDWNELTSNLEGKIDFTCSFSDENKEAANSDTPELNTISATPSLIVSNETSQLSNIENSSIANTNNQRVIQVLDFPFDPIDSTLRQNR